MRKNRIAVLVAFTLALALASLSVSAASKTVTIKVEGMHCGGCSSSLEKKLKATEGVEQVTVSYEKGEAQIKYDDQKTSEAKLREAINSTGFKAVEQKSEAGK
jgi:copper chaperone CopZ